MAPGGRRRRLTSLIGVILLAAVPVARSQFIFPYTLLSVESANDERGQFEVRFAQEEDPAKNPGNYSWQILEVGQQLLPDRIEVRVPGSFPVDIQSPLHWSARVRGDSSGGVYISWLYSGVAPGTFTDRFSIRPTGISDSALSFSFFSDMGSDFALDPGPVSVSGTLYGRVSTPGGTFQGVEHFGSAAILIPEIPAGPVFVAVGLLIWLGFRRGSSE